MDTKNSLDPARTGRRGNKLSSAGRRLVIERVLAGDANAVIVQKLKEANLLHPQDSLTRQALARYRNSPACRVQQAWLTEQAQLTAHRELSEGVVAASLLAAEARKRLREAATAPSKRLSARALAEIKEAQGQAIRLARHAFPPPRPESGGKPSIIEGN